MKNKKFISIITKFLYHLKLLKIINLKFNKNKNFSGNPELTLYFFSCIYFLIIITFVTISIVLGIDYILESLNWEPSEYVLSSLFIFLNKNKIPSWFKTIIYDLIVIYIFIIIYKYLGLYNEMAITNFIKANLYWIKIFYIIWCILIIIILFYNIIYLWIITQFSNKCLKMPTFLPQSTKNWLKFLHHISKLKKNIKIAYIKLFYKLIILYFFSLILCFFIIFLI